MADSKISALSSATTPLAGTEVLPIVQSGATVKVAVSNLTAGRTVSADKLTLTATNGLINPGTADGSDNKTITISGGGANSAARGANLSLSGNESTTEIVTVGGDVIVQTGNAAGAAVYIYQSGTEIAKFAAAGVSLTGTLSATGIVTFSNYGAGAATFSASGVISSVSDETWKIKDGIPTDPDAMLKKLEPGYWFYNEEKAPIYGADRQLGFYAQNVHTAIGPEAAPEPEVVITKAEDGSDISTAKPWGYYDRSVLAITVMSLQKALATIDSLTDRIAILEAK